SDFLSIPLLFIELDLSITVTFYPVFYSSENHFHENGLRTNPTTENTSESYRKHRNEYHSDNHGDHHQIKVLRKKRNPENIELSLKEIQQYKLMSVYLYKWKRKQHQ